MWTVRRQGITNCPLGATMVSPLCREHLVLKRYMLKYLGSIFTSAIPSNNSEKFYSGK